MAVIRRSRGTPRSRHGLPTKGTTRGARATAAAVVAVSLLFAACSSDNRARAASSASASSSTASALRPLRVLVTNDDGVGAPGIDAIVQALTSEPAIQVDVVAPAQNQSGSGARTTSGELTANETTTASGHRATAVQGFPADSVVYALTKVLTEPPDLVVSGANAGQNIGPFIDVSGTVGAAREAARRGIPALAVSAGLGDPIDYRPAVAAAISWLRAHRDELVAPHPAPTFVTNINAPTCPAGAVRGDVDVQPDPTAAGDLALAPPDCTSKEAAPATDVAAFHDGFVTTSEVSLQPAG